MPEKTRGRLLDGKGLAAQCMEEIASRAAQYSERPGLAVVLIGEDPASHIYVEHKRRDCAKCGIYSEAYTLDAGASQAQALDLISALNERADIDGILVQLPLPAGFEERTILEAVEPGKDVDCFHPYNVGRLMSGTPLFLPCTPAGVMRLLSAYGIDPAGKHAVVVGRSNIVGKPQGILLLQSDATVTLCHSRTPDLGEMTRQADILVSAAGKAGLITADMVREGAVVVDVAMNRTESGKLCGDVDFEPVSRKASFITPVPGGVGPMTRAMLLENTLRAAEAHGKR